MSGALQATALIGSPRKAGSTSAVFAGALLDELARRGAACQRRFVGPAVADGGLWSELSETVGAADLLILATPLYVDSLPGPVTQALERLDAERPWGERKPAFAFLVNCGFPEAVHNQTAVAIARLFAHQAGLEWRGALAVGGGEAIAGKALAQLGRHATHLRQGIELAGAALAAGQAIPSDAVRLAAAPLVPPWIYRVMAGVSMRRRAFSHGVHHRIGKRPFD